jgi:hypothetical protein
MTKKREINKELVDQAYKVGFDHARERFFEEFSFWADKIADGQLEASGAVSAAFQLVANVILREPTPSAPDLEDYA